MSTHMNGFIAKSRTGGGNITASYSKASGKSNPITERKGKVLLDAKVENKDIKPHQIAKQSR